jgi:hypothetical protein
VAIDEQHFAVLDRQGGVMVYNLTKGNRTKDNDGFLVQLETTISKDRFDNAYTDT